MKVNKLALSIILFSVLMIVLYFIAVTERGTSSKENAVESSVKEFLITNNIHDYITFDSMKYEPKDRQLTFINVKFLEAAKPVYSIPRIVFRKIEMENGFPVLLDLRAYDVKLRNLMFDIRVSYDMTKKKTHELNIKYEISRKEEILLSFTAEFGNFKADHFRNILNVLKYRFSGEKSDTVTLVYLDDLANLTLKNLTLTMKDLDSITGALFKGDPKKEMRQLLNALSRKSIQKTENGSTVNKFYQDIDQFLSNKDSLKLTIKPESEFIVKDFALYYQRDSLDLNQLILDAGIRTDLTADR